MAAFLGQHLVFDLDRRRACVFQFAHRAHHVKNPAETGIGIHDQRQSGGAANRAREQAQFLQANNAEIRKSKAGAERRAGKIKRLKARLFRKQSANALCAPGIARFPAAATTPPAVRPAQWNR